MREYIRRANDWKILAGLVVSFGAVIGMAAALFAWPSKWNKGCDDIEAIKPRIAVLEQNQQISRTDMAVIKAQYSDIHEQLAYLIRNKDR